jgi:hypothetical protein
MKPSTIANVLPELINDGISVLVHGKAGIGKSSVVKQVTKTMKRDLYDLRLSQLSEVDLRGLPMHDPKTKQAVWYPPNFLPKPDAKPSVLFLDEINKAHPAVLSAAYQLILDRRLGDYRLPDNCGLIAAGNTVSDRGDIHTIPAPLNNRFIHIDFELDPEDWQRQASADDVTPAIRAYHRLKGGAALHVFDAAINPRAFPTPRSWYTVDKIHKNKKYTASERVQLVAGTIGEGESAAFHTFLNELTNMPDIDSILLNPKEAKLPGSQSVMHTVVTTLVDKCRAANYAKLMVYIERLQTEMQVVFNRHVVIKDHNITSRKEYIDWCLKNQAVFGVI